MKKQILYKGYYCTKDEDAFQFIDIYSVQWSELGIIPLQMCVRTPETQTTLLQTQTLLGEKYIRPIFGDYTCNYVDLVKGLDDNVFDWHTDYR